MIPSGGHRRLDTVKAEHKDRLFRLRWQRVELERDCADEEDED